MSPPLTFELGRCQKIYDTKILQSNHILTQSALIEILIRLDYILQLLSKSGKRVEFSDDVSKGDITDLVNNMRNAACHSDSHRNKMGTGTLIYNIFSGYCPSAISINGNTLGCSYVDDIAFNYGSSIIYLERHIHRLLKELPSLIS